MKFHLTGDIKHAGIVEVEAADVSEAINKALDGDFIVVDEQGKDLAFEFADHITDEDNNDLDHLL